MGVSVTADAKRGLQGMSLAFAAARIVKPNLSRDLVLQRSMSRPSTSVTFEMGGLLTKAMESLAVAGRWRRPPDGA